MIKEYSYGIIPFYIDLKGRTQVLLIKNRSGEHRGFPKGHLQKGEAPIDAAVREFREETGAKTVDVDATKTFKEQYIFPQGKEMISKCVVYYAGYLARKKVHIQEEEISDYRWLPLLEARDLITYDNLKKLFDKVIKYLALP